MEQLKHFKLEQFGHCVNADVLYIMITSPY